MSRKVVRTPETSRVEAMVLARSHNKHLGAIIKSIADAHMKDGFLSLAFPYEWHSLQAIENVVELERILGPVQVEFLPMLSVGLELGGIVTKWE